MYKTYKFRLYPDNDQKILINKTFGSVRFVYNYFLKKCKEDSYQNAVNMCKDLKDLMEEYSFLKEVDGCSLRNSIFNLEDSYKSFFSKRAEYPTFKNKYSKQSYKTTYFRSNFKGRDYISIELNLKDKKIKLPKLGLVNIRGYRNLDNINGRIISATVVMELTNKYYVSVLVDEVEYINKRIQPASIVGIDLGVKDLVITSDGKKYMNPKEILKREKSLKRLQKKLSRQVRGSSNYNKTRERIARIYSKIKNGRKHNIIGIVNELVKDHDIIVSEKLNVRDMSSNHNLAKAILDASFNKICELLKWKAKLQGKYYYQVDTFYPSSKICSHCGDKTDKTDDLGVRKWECFNCGCENDRDMNASINIMFEGLRIHYQT